jgi:hypothetical protein
LKYNTNMISRSSYCKIAKSQFILYFLFTLLLVGIVMTFLFYPYMVISDSYFDFTSIYVIWFYLGIMVIIVSGMMIILTLIRCSEY